MAPPADAAITPTDPAGAEPIEGSEIIARVDGQVILASDVLWQVRQLIKIAKLKNPAAVPPGHERDVEQMLSRQLVMGMLDTKMLYADFRRTVPAENYPKIEESLAKPFEEVEIPRLLEMLKLENRANLEGALEASGTSLKDVQRQFNEKTIAGQWLREKAPKARPITVDELLAYYQDNQSKYEFEAKAKWEELMVRFDRVGGDRDEAWRQLCAMGNEVWESAQRSPGLRGPAFGQVAKAHSDGVTAAAGGVYDWTAIGALRCEGINEALANLAIGQMSPGIESEQGFHIIRVLERTPAGRVPFTEAQAEIRTLLENEQRMAGIEQELKRLRAGARAWTIFDGDLSGARLCELLDEQTKRR